MQLSLLLQTFRPSFLVLTPVCVLLGISASYIDQHEIEFFLITLVLIGAIAAHISVNTLNEYFDFKSGLDLKTDKTPFSGGSGILPAHPELAPYTLYSGLIALLITVLIGVYFLYLRGLILLPVGLIGVAIILTYTQWLNRNAILCLIASGTGFGLLMVLGTYIVLTGTTKDLPWLIALVPFFLVNNLLLLNQYPDIEADKSAGRQTFPIVFGVKISNLIYALFALATLLSIVLIVTRLPISKLTLLSLIPASLSFVALYGAIRFRKQIGQQPKYLAVNVVTTIATPLFLGLAILLV